MRFSWLYSWLGFRKLSRRQRRYLKRKRAYIPLRVERLEDRLAPTADTWTGAAGTLNWTDAANWSTGAVPISTDDVQINTPVSGPITVNIANAANQSIHSLTDTTAALNITGGSLAITANSSISQNLAVAGGSLAASGQLNVDGTYTQSGGTFTGIGTLTVTGPTVWTGGTMTGTGITAIQGSLTLSGGGGESLNGRTLDNYGTANWTGYENYVYLSNGAVWNNEAGSVFDSQNDGQVLYNDGGTGTATFNNAGSVEKTAGTGIIYIQTAFNNTGSVQVQTGTVNLQGGGSASGSFTVGSGATLELDAGTYTLQAGASESGAGELLVANGTLAVNGSATVQNLTQTGGTLTGPGTLTVTGQQAAWSGGTMTGTGITAIQGSLTLSGGGGESLNGRTLDNYGTANWTGTGNYIYLSNGAVWNNEAGGVFDSQNDGQVLYNDGGTGTATFNNAGTVEKTAGTGTTYIQTAFNNTGSVQVQTGTVNLQGGGSDSGSLTVSSGATLDLGTYTLQAGASESGAGALLVDNGTLTVNANTTVQNLTQTGGTLTGPGSVTVTGQQAVWSGGTMTGTGLTVIKGSMTLSSGNNGDEYLNGRTLDNYGTVNWTGTGNYIYLSNGSVWNNEAGSVFDSQNDGQVVYDSGGTGTAVFNNAGLFEKTAGTGTIYIQTAFNNTGSVQVQTGTLSLQRSVTDTASFAVSSGADLQFAGNTTTTLSSGASVGNAGTVEFSSGTVSFATGAVYSGTGTVLVDGGTVDFSTGNAVQLAALTETNGTLQGSDTVTVTGQAVWTGGYMSGTGTTVAAGGLQLGAADGNYHYEYLSGRTLENAGNATWQGNEYGYFYQQNGSTFENLAGATLDIHSDLPWYSNGTNSFVNQGTLNKSAGTGSTSIQTAFNNSGSVQVQSGTLSLQGGGTSSSSSSGSSSSGGGSSGGGTFTVSSGADLQFDGSSTTLTSGASLSNAGTVEFSGGTVSFATGAVYSGTGTVLVDGGTVDFSTGSAVQLAALTESNGTLQGSDTVTVTGQTVWTGGTMAGKGTTVAAGGLQLGAADGNYHYEYLNGRTLENTGNAVWQGNGYFYQQNSSTFENLAGATLDIQSDLPWYSDGSANSFVNQGTLTKSAGTATTSIQPVFSNPGTLDIESGTLDLQGGLSNFSGNTLSGGTYIVHSTLQFNGASIQTNDANIVLDGPGSQIVDQNGADALANLGQTQVYATSSYAGGPPDAAFDGNLQTAWNAGTDTGSITKEFPAPLTFDTVLLSAEASPTTSETYTIFGSSDGVTFTQLAQSTQTVVNGPVDTLAPISFPATTARYLRISVNGNSSWVAINEVSLMLAGTPIPSTALVGGAVQSGSLTIENGRNFTAPGDYVSAGQLTVGSGSTFTAPLVDLQGGSLNGTGTIAGDVINAGTVNPGTASAPGKMTINGSYTQTAEGTLNEKIAGNTIPGTDYDQLVVSGTASLGGTINVSVINGFKPQSGDQYQIMQFASSSGDFTTKNGFSLGGGNALTEQLDASNLTLVVNQARLKFLTEPGNSVASELINPGNPVQVEILDANGNLLTSDNSDTVTLTLNQNSFDPSSTLTATVSGGIATFNNLIIDKAANGYQITAVSSGIGSVASAPLFSVTPDVPAKLVFLAEPPSSAHVGDTLSSIQVQVEDHDGNLETGYSGSVTLALSSNPSALGGTVTENVSGGTATFGDLTVSEAGTYQLMATSGSVPSQASSSVTINPLDTSVYVNSISPDALTVNANPQTINFTAQVYNLDNSFPVNEGTVSFTVYDPNGNAVGQPVVSNTVSNGSASATFTLPGNANALTGAYTVTASYAPGPEFLGSNQAYSSYFYLYPQPTALSQSVIVEEGVASPITLPSSDPTGDPLAYTIVQGPSDGQLTGTGASLTYTPKSGFTGSDSFQFTVTDTVTGYVSSPATITVTVVPPPVASSQSLSVGEGNPQAITLVNTDPNDDPLYYTITASPQDGQLSGSGPDLTYTPKAGFTGSDSFQFTVTDAASGLVSNVATVTLNVAAAPVVSGQSVSTGEGIAKAITLSSTDPNGDLLNYTVTTQPAGGQVTGSGANLTYTPNTGFSGSDSFQFTTTDTATGLVSNTGIVSITVIPPPVASARTVVVGEGLVANIGLSSTDPNGDPLTYTITTPPQDGQLVGSGPNLTYTPKTGFTGVDSFQFTVTDTATGLVSNTATIALVVVPAPVASNQGVTTGVGVAQVIAVSSTDPNGDLLTYTITTPPQNGQLSGSGPNLTYTPIAGFSGSDSFQFSVTDTATGLVSNVATITLTVVPAPVASNQSVTVQEGNPEAITLGSTDPNSDPLTYTITTPPQNGQLSGSGSNLSYTPNAGFSGSDSFQFSTTDTVTGLVSAPAVVSISVTSTTATLTLTLDRTAVSEAAGANAATATITRNDGLDTDLVVTLASSDTSAATVPATVTILAGQTSATFSVAAVDDGLVDAAKTPTLTASAAGFVTGTASLTVNNSDVPALQVSLDETTVEEGGSVTGEVQRNWITGAPLAVTFSASTDGRMVLPVVIIAANQSSASFTIATTHDVTPAKDEVFTVTAAAGGFVSGTADLTITDHEDLPTLSITPDTTVLMKDGAGTTFTVSRAVVANYDLSVKLSTSDATIAVPEVATVDIPAGQTSATFVVDPVNNAIVDGTQYATITANGTYVPCGCTILSGAGTATVEVLDTNEPAVQLTSNNTSALEGIAGAFTVTVTRNTSLADDLVVNLTSSNPTELPVPDSVTIPAGQASATLVLNTGADPNSSGSIPVSLTATATGLASAELNLTVVSRNSPDLGVSSVSLPTSGLMGQAASVSWNVTNFGQLTAVAPWVERVYFSQNPVLDSSAQLAGELTINQSLSAGASLTRSVPVTLPSVPGTYYAIVVVDATNVIPDSNTNNNQAVSVSTVDVQPTYSVTVATTTTIAPSGTAVQFTGKATLTGSTDPAANVPVTVRVIKDGQFRRVLTATTDADGSYTATFTPLPTEAGYYTVAAAHPAVVEDVTQAQFELVGMQTDQTSLSLRVAPGTPLTGTITVSNLGSVPLSGLSVAVLNAPANITVNTSLSSTNLASNGSVTLGYTITAADASTPLGHLQLQITSAEGTQTEVSMDVTVVPLTPQLTSDPGSLLQGVVVGGQKVVSFNVSNIGGAPTGPLQVQLPTDIPWMSLASPATIPSLAPGQSTTVTLILTPPADTPLALYEGTISLTGADTQLNVGFQIRTVSTAVGDLQVSVQDEYTFYAAGAPLVAGATVKLLDPYDNTVIVAQGTTDSSGQVTLTQVPEGTYVLDVSAPQHDPYQAPVNITAGILNQSNVFISRQLVTYNWVVSPGQITDDYSIQLQSTFATGVPAPVVTLDLPNNIPVPAPGEQVQVDAVLTNHGLIATHNNQLFLPTVDGFTITALTTDLGTLPAMSSVTIPIIIARTPGTAALGTGGGVGTICEYLDFFDLGTYNCGLSVVLERSAAVSQFSNGSCSGGNSTYVGGVIKDAQKESSDAIGKYGEYTFYYWDSSYFYGGSCTPQMPGTGGANDVTPAGENVCAQVRLQLDQTAVTARSVFTGGMEIDNGSTTGSLTGVQISLQFLDADGNPANDKFTIVGPDLTGLTAADGTGVLAAGTSGLATYTFIPDDDAAASGPTQYQIEGSLSYIDPDTGEEVVIPLVGTSITVLPNPKLVLNYFLQRDVVGDDPDTPQVEPSEPFTLGLLATNVGAGTADNFTITSSQPQIVENQKGLLINFSILGSQVGDQPTNPSLTVDLGNLAPGQTQVATWSLESTLAGQFIGYSATFTHDNALGGTQTSLIDSVAIHELVHQVQANRPGDDDLPDFLANDSGNPDGLPDTLYLSDGTVAPVNIATSVATDGPVSADHRQITLTANQTSGWSYIVAPDPGAGWKLVKVVRSDGTQIQVGPDAWQTDKVLNKTTNTFDDDPELHLFDFNGTGSYTLYYAENISTPPTITQITPVSPDPRNAPVDSVDVTFSEPIDLTTFNYQALTLTQNAGPNLITSAVAIALVAGTDSTYQISGLTGLTTANGAYTLTVDATKVLDLGDNAGIGTASIDWSNGVAPPYVKQISPVTPGTRNTPVDSIDVQVSLPIDPASFTTSALQLTLNGQSVALPNGVSVTALDDTGTNFEISGLSAATTAQGNYSLTVNASGFQGSDGLTGLGSKSVSWVMDTTPPTLVSLQQPQSPRNIVVQSFDVVFSEPINLATFNRSNLELDYNGAPVTLDDRVTVQPEPNPGVLATSGTVYQITGLNWFMGEQGTYTLTVNAAGVQDLAGNIGSGTASVTWVEDFNQPDAPTNVALTPDRGISSSDGLTNTQQLTITGNVDQPGLNVRVYDYTTGTEIGFGAANGLSFAIPVTIPSVGHHILWVNSVDAAGNVSDNTVLDAFIDETPPTVVQINGVPAAPTESPVDALDVVFSKPINLATFDYHALSLTLNGGPNLIDSGVTISQVTDTTYAISGLTALTAASGTYQLTLDTTQVQDLAGNAGQTPASVSWTTITADTTPPTSAATSPASVSDFNFTVQWSGQDNPGGSGIAYYDVYSNVDGGPFTLWQYHTTATSATFMGSDQHTYGFFSIATDVAGNQEAMKTTADTTTFVSVRGEIHGRVFEDINQSGTDTAGTQNGLQGWTVFLDLQNDGRLDPGDPSTTTAADGSFAFTGLEPGTYTVGEIVQPGWQLTYPTTGASSVQEVQATVGVSDAPVYLADTTAPASDASSTAVNQALIDLNQFHNDPRFAAITGQGESVVVLDSGVDVTNPYFGPLDASGVASGIVYQYNFVNNTTSAPDVLGHGTLVASIIGSRDATNPGVAPGVQIIDLKVLDDKGSGQFSNVAQALQWVADNAAKYNIVAVNMSFGDGGDYTQPQSLDGLGGVLSELAQENVIAVAAAGNNFYGDQSVSGVAYPAADPNVLPVGAVWASDQGGPFAWSNGAVDYSTSADQIMSFSQRDAQLGEVFAPGAFIQGTSPGDGVATMSGTSMASAAVTGVVALADQLAEQTLGRTLTLAELRYLLATTSATITDNGSDNVQNTGLTYDRVDVETLAEGILSLKTNPIPTTLLPPASSGSGGTAVAQSTPSGENSVNLSAGAVVTGVDFGNFLPGQVSGTVYLDNNGNGQLDSGEAGLSGWTVTLHANNGSVPDQTCTTGASGAYSFAGLAAGNYTLSETRQPGYQETQPGAAGSLAYTFTVTSEFTSTFNFGNQVFAAPTGLGISPDTGLSAADGITDTGALTFFGTLNQTGLTVHLVDLTTGTDLGNSIVSGTSFSASLTLAEGAHRIQATATDAAGNVSAPGNFTMLVDLTPPISTVAALPAFSPGSFTVNWSGSDNAGGSGLASYSVYVSDNGGAFTPLLTDTTLTSTTFTGVDGHTYSFYSVATDNAGNVQATPTSAQASTTVDTAPPTSSVAALPSFSPGSFTLNWSGSDGNGSGIGLYSVYVSDNGGAFTPLLTDTKRTSTTLTGINGHTYGFYSVATDNVGNVQPTPSSAQATTTVDTVAPFSSVTALPAFSPATFTLNWSGSDNPGGSGLSNYSIYISDNGGAFAPLLTNTTQTSMAFTGVDGHTYSFYSVASDKAGNVQATPTSAQASTTVDATPPTSSVAALPSFSPGSFTLNWSGSDGNGSGISSYSVYSSDNGGAFTPLLTDTKQTSTTFTGVNGHTYGFYSVATDNVGNVQATPTAAQASTTVDTVPPTSSIVALTTFSPVTFTVSWSGSDNLGGSGLSSYSIYVSDNGGTFTPLLTNTTQTSTTFTGVAGHSYGFYSVATDNVGNTQPTPTAAQATTTVSAPSLSVVSTTTLSLLQGEPTGSVVLATFTQGSATQPASAYTATVVWGDGQSDASTEPNSPISIQVSAQTISIYGTHTYTTAGTQNLSVTLSTTGASATAYPTTTVVPNVSSQIRSSASGLVYNRSTGLFGGTITLTNTGTTNLTGTLLVELTGLPSGVTLNNASGTAPDGNPYILVSLSNGILAPGKSVTFNVYFRNPNRLSFSYGLTTFDQTTNG